MRIASVADQRIVGADERRARRVGVGWCGVGKQAASAVRIVAGRAAALGFTDLCVERIGSGMAGERGVSWEMGADPEERLMMGGWNQCGDRPMRPPREAEHDEADDGKYAAPRLASAKAVDSRIPGGLASHR